MNNQHLVQQQITTQYIMLTCLDCDWQATLGYTRNMSYEELQVLSPVAVIVKWSHVDPTLLEPLNETTPERSFLQRIRDYMVKGVAP